MKQLDVLAIDDEAPALRRLVKMVEDHEDLHLAGTARNSVEAKEKILQLKPGLLLLDIELKDATAFDMLTDVRNDYKGKIIFCTAFDQYALKAFEYQAIDYLLKPYSDERFRDAVSRIIQKEEKTDLDQLIQIFSERSNSRLMIPEGNKNYFLDKEKLMYIIAEGYYANFISKDEKKTIRISLKKLEETLPANFIRINKSAIINKDLVSELLINKSSSKVIMPDKSELFVSEKIWKELRSNGVWK